MRKKSRSCLPGRTFGEAEPSSSGNTLASSLRFKPYDKLRADCCESRRSVAAGRTYLTTPHL
jgi:hypothetical protein